VPSGRVIGGLHGGWAATMTMLQHERRGTSVRLRAGQGTVSFEWLLAAIGERGIGDQPVVRQRMAELYVRQRSLELFRARLDQQLRAGAGPGARGSVGKLAWAELDRFAVDVAAELIGTDGVAWDEDSPDGHRWAEALCVALSTAIAGGTNEIQRTVIGERVLGLPREPAC
ncbi:MAG: acyl-CoA dehydrogenase family protein, partial [Pseudonocardiaceae bacterium]